MFHLFNVARKERIIHERKLSSSAAFKASNISLPISYSSENEKSKLRIQERILIKNQKKKNNNNNEINNFSC